MDARLKVTHTDNLGELAGAMCKVQKALMPVVRDKTAKIETRGGGAYEYEYADLDSVLDEKVRALLSENGIALFQPPCAEGSAVTVVTLLVHAPSNQWMRGELEIIASGPGAQAIGSAITYARRYSVMGMVGIIAKGEDDDGKAATAHPQHETRAPIPPDRPLSHAEIKTKFDEATSVKTVLALVRRHVDPIVPEGQKDHPLRVLGREAFKRVDALEKANAPAHR